MNGDSCNKVVVAFTQPDRDKTHFIGVMVGYHDHPTVLVDAGDGHQHCWAAHLMCEATPDEAIAYWRQRAEAAEQALQRTSRL